jgi:3-phenylpropionate/cinnamic acid dioxygenase small subunit
VAITQAARLRTGDPRIPAPDSHYVDDAFYAELRQVRDALAQRGRPLTADERAVYEELVLHENWLLDQGRFEDWFDLCTDDCFVWAPTSFPPGDPQREVAIVADDRRRLRDRIAWIRTALASAQIPESRTTHLLGAPVRVPWDSHHSTPDTDVLLRASYQLTEVRTEGLRTLAGWCGWVLRAGPEGPLVHRKIVALVDADRGHRNLTFFL